MLPGSIKERAETLLVANRARLESEAPELEVDDNDSMPPPSIVPLQVSSGSSSSSHLFYPIEDFAICYLQSALCVSQEEYLEEIAELKNKLKAGPSKSKGRK